MNKKEKIKYIVALILCPLAISYFLFKKFGIDSAIVVVATFWLIAICSILNSCFARISRDYFVRLGKIIGEILAVIALTIIYICAIIPTGIISKLAKRDRLNLKKSSLKSYWKDVAVQEKSYENQF